MKLRDLTEKQIHELQVKCLKDQTKYIKAHDRTGKHYNNVEAWKAAYSAGIKAVLELIPK